MQQNGAFRDDAAGTDIVMELYKQESLTNVQSRTELDNNLLLLNIPQFGAWRSR